MHLYTVKPLLYHATHSIIGRKWALIRFSCHDDVSAKGWVINNSCSENQSGCPCALLIKFFQSLLGQNKIYVAYIFKEWCVMNLSSSSTTLAYKGLRGAGQVTSSLLYDLSDIVNTKYIKWMNKIRLQGGAVFSLTARRSWVWFQAEAFHCGFPLGNPASFKSPKTIILCYYYVC